MALFAACPFREDRARSLPDFLDAHVSASIGTPLRPDPRVAEGFRTFFARYLRGLAVDAEAVKALR